MNMLRKKTPTAVELFNDRQWALDTLREYLLAIITTNVSRYSERFESS